LIGIFQYPNDEYGKISQEILNILYAVGFAFNLLFFVLAVPSQFSKNQPEEMTEQV